ncbi:MAG: GntR family transcriptional regulator [Pseudarcicella sp.]|nr:GntR family transcriptional regulator [Pseudarcicella sp.]
MLGKYNRLKVIKELDFGLYLDGYEDEILIPRVYVPEGTQIDDYLDVFIYKDSEDRLIATTLKPFTTVGEFAYLTVKDVSKLGVFLDWGLMKDLLVPFGEQITKMAVGKSYLVYTYIDEETDRIVASAKIENFFSNTPSNWLVNQQVEIIPYEYTDLGVKAMVNKCEIGVIYKSEIFKDVNLGVQTIGFIKKIRPDGKIDLALEKQSYDRIIDNKNLIISKLEDNNGFIPFNDKSTPESIYEEFKISKKDFKKMVGGLLKEQLIRFEDGGIRLN